MIAPASSLAKRDVAGLLSAEELGAWRKPKPRELVVDLAGPWLQIAAALVAAAAVPHPLVLVPAFFVIAGALHGINCITHEFAHHLVLPRRPRWNDLIGAWLYAAPGGLPFGLYRRRHFDHHRLVSTDDDTKRLYQRDFSGWRMGYEVLLSLGGFDYFWQVISVLRRKSAGDAAGRKGIGQFLGDVIPVVVVQAIIAAVLIETIGFWLYLLLWPWPLVAATLFGKLRSTVEHTPMRAEWTQDPGSPYFRRTEAPVVRSVIPTPFERLFLSRVNFNYHREHHLWPGLSYQYLPRAYDKLRLHLQEPIARGYLRKLREFVRDA
jgi:fatty acid desaturase